MIDERTVPAGNPEAVVGAAEVQPTIDQRDVIPVPESARATAIPDEIVTSIDQYHLGPILKALQNADGDTDDFNELLWWVKDQVTLGEYLALRAQMSHDGYESVAEHYHGDSECPGDCPELRAEICEAATSTIYFFADGSALKVENDEFKVWRNAITREEPPAQSAATEAA